MRVRTMSVCVTACAMLLGWGPARAAHFEESGTRYVSFSDDLTLTLVELCNWGWEGGTDTLTIAPDAGESAGDDVTVSYCYDLQGVSAVTGEGYTALGGIGGTSFTVGCLPEPTYDNPDPATLIVNPGPGERVEFSLGPKNLEAGAPPSSESGCETFIAQIGDVLRAEGALFGVVTGPASSAGTYVTGSYFASIELESSPGIPALGRWGAVVLGGLLALAAVALLLRRRVTA